MHLPDLLAGMRNAHQPTAVRTAPEALSVKKELRFAGWRLDLPRRALRSPRGKVISLTAAEFELLAALVTQPNQVLTRDQLLEMVAPRKWSPSDRTIDQHVSQLRQKIERDPKRPELIKSVRGKGYVLTALVDEFAAEAEPSSGKRSFRRISRRSR